MTRWIKWCVLGFASLVTLLVVSGATVYVYFQSPSGQSLVLTLLLNKVNEDLSTTVDVSEVSGDWPQHIRIGSLTIGDVRGAWLVAEDLSIRWIPLSLFLGRIEFDSIEAETVRLSRLPEPSASQDSSLEDVFAIAGALDNVVIEGLSVNRVEISPDIIANELALELTGTLRSIDGPATLSLQVTDFDSDGHARAIASRVGSQISWSMDLSTRGSTLYGEGMIELRRQVLNGSFQYTISAQLLDDLGISFAEDALSGQTDLSINRDTVLIQSITRIEDFRLGQRSLQSFTAESDVSLEGNGWSLSGTGLATGLHSAVPGAADVLDDRVSFDLAGLLITQPGQQALSVDRFRLTSGQQEIIGKGQIDVVGGEVNAELTLNGRGLLRLIGIEDSESRSRMTVIVNGINAAGDTRGSFSGTLDSLAPDLVLSDFFENEATVRGRFAIEDDGAFVIDAAELFAPHGVLTGSTRWSNDGRHDETNMELTIPDVSIIQEKTSGPLRIQATATGPTDSLFVTSSISSDGISVRRLMVSDVSLVLTGTNVDGHWQGNGSGSMITPDGPLLLRGELARDHHGLIGLSNLSLDSATGSATGSVRFNPETSMTDGGLQIAFSSLALLSDVLQFPVRGQGTTDLSFTPVEDRQSIRVASTIQNFVGGPDYSSARRVSISGDFGDIWGELNTQLKINAERGDLLGRPYEILAMSVMGPAKSAEISLSVNGTPTLIIEADAQLSITKPTQSLTVNALHITVDETKLKLLEKPLSLSFTEQRRTLSRTMLSLGKGMVSIAGTIDRHSSQIDADIKVEKVPLKLPTLLTPDLETTGAVSGYLVVNGTLSEPRMQFSASTGTMDLPDANLTDITLAAEGDVENGRLILNVHALGLSSEPAQLSLSLPFIVDLEETRISVPLNTPASGSLLWHGSVGPLWRLVPVVTHRLTGEGVMDFALAGTLNAPKFMGTAQLLNGTYENLQIGTLLRNMQATLTASSGRELTINTIANDGAAGTVRGTGQFRFEADQSPTVDFRLNMENAHLIRRDRLSARGTGALEYTGKITTGTLSGTIAVENAEVRLNESFAPAISLIEVEELGSGSVHADMPTAQAQPALVGFDVDLELKDPVSVSGRGLASSWTGALSLQGTNTAPELLGALTLDRGEFAFLGETFTLTQGFITFIGNRPIDPELSVSAELTQSDFTARVEASGRSSAPVFTLTSDPVVPQDEVLSRVLFDRSAGQLGPLEAVQLANAASDFSGLAEGGGVMGSLRRAVGLDVLRLGGADGNSVVVGTRLGRSVYVGVEQGLDGIGRQIVVDWKIGKNLSLESSTNEETGADIGLSWRKDY